MAAPPPETIPSTRITATDPANPQTFGPFGPYSVDIATAEITIDRTVNGGLNSLAPGTTCNIGIDYSIDGAPFLNCAGIESEGDTVVVKNGVTSSIPSDATTVRPWQPFPANRTRFRVTAAASVPVRIAGTVDYT